jgi:hypothetical protein
MGGKLTRRNGTMWQPLRDRADDLIRRKPRPEGESAPDDEQLQEEVRAEYRLLRERLASTGGRAC